MKSHEKCVAAGGRDPDEENPRVKIAVWDTGLYSTRSDIAKQYGDGQIKIRDFIGKGKSQSRISTAMEPIAPLWFWIMRQTLRFMSAMYFENLSFF